MPDFYRLDIYSDNQEFTCIELCAGAGGQALGLEAAGFKHLALIELDQHCCKTLQMNSNRQNKNWNVIEDDIKSFLHKHNGYKYKGQVDLIAGGLPCPPFSIAGKKLGANDERNLFPAAIEIIKALEPKAIMIENVKGILEEKFVGYRNWLYKELASLGYESDWSLLNSSDFGVSQLRPRAILIGFKKEMFEYFEWPNPIVQKLPTVGDLILDLMEKNGWKNAQSWSKKANEIAPTIVGGSKKHGGPDLGPTRSKKAWSNLEVDGHGIANQPPDINFDGKPKLTVQMVARIQGFSDEWIFSGGKTAQYRQVGNAFPPPVAKAVGDKLFEALLKYGKTAKVEVVNE